MQFLTSDHMIPSIQSPILNLNSLLNVVDAEAKGKEDNAGGEEKHG